MIAAANVADLPIFPYRGVPELGVVGECEPRRRHTNHDVEVAIERELGSDDPRIGGEIAPPCAVGQDEHLGRGPRIFTGRKHSPELRVGAQRREELRAYPSCVDAQWGSFGAEQVEVLPALDGDDAREAVRLVPEVDQILRREHHRGFSRIGPVQVHEPVRPLEAQWLEEHAVHKAERRGAGADRERQGGERDQRERGRARKSARGIPQFLDGCFHIEGTVEGRGAQPAPVTTMGHRTRTWGLNHPHSAPAQARNHRRGRVVDSPAPPNPYPHDQGTRPCRVPVSSRRCSAPPG